MSTSDKPSYFDAFEAFSQIEILKRKEKDRNIIDFEIEKQFKVNYKGIELNHHFFADFIVFGKIILEIKSIKSLNDSHIAQTINYLKVSGLKVALLINFGDSSLTYKRIVL